MKYEYDSKLAPDQALVVLVLPENDPELNRLAGRVSDSGLRYGFSCQITDDPSSTDASGFVCSHAIVVTSRACSPPFVTAMLEKTRDFSSVSFAFRYESAVAMESASAAIESLKITHGDRVNFLRPDRFCAESVYVSEDKLIDNAVCDTLRVKYIPRCENPQPIKLPPHVESFFRRASLVYDGWKMYHRSPNDGYFAVRGDDGFFITATKTRKPSLNISRISLVHSYDEDRNELRYDGEYLPSSDSVEAAAVFDQCAHIGALIHTHASVQFTRNPHYRDRIVVGQLCYGERELARELAAALKSSDGFVIMAEHGEVFAGREEDLPDRINALCSGRRWQ